MILEKYCQQATTGDGRFVHRQRYYAYGVFVQVFPGVKGFIPLAEIVPGK